MRDIKSHIGVKRSEDTKKKISDALKGRKIPRDIVNKVANSLRGKKHSLETRLKRAEHRYEAILQYDLNGNLLKEWKGPTEAAKTLNIRRGGIYSMLHGGMKSYKGFVWKYKNIQPNQWKF